MNKLFEATERIRRKNSLEDIVSAYTLRAKQLEIPDTSETVQKIVELAAVAKAITEQKIEFSEKIDTHSLLHFALTTGKQKLVVASDLYGRVSRLIKELNEVLYPSDEVAAEPEPVKLESKPERKARLFKYYSNHVEEVWLAILGQLVATDSERLDIYMKLALDPDSGFFTNSTELFGLLVDDTTTEADLDAYIAKVKQKILSIPLIKEKLPK